MSEDLVSVRYMVDDVDAAIKWYTRHLGFSLLNDRAPGFRGREARVVALVAERGDQLRRTCDARWRTTATRRLESDSPRRR